MRLHHHYSALRHGESLANVAGVISSDPRVACLQHGLSDKGKRQASLAAETIASEAKWLAVDGVAIVSSDLRRAWQTALIVRNRLKAAGVRVWPEEGVLEDKALRERSFGELNGEPDSRYNDVWVEDARSCTHNEYGVESVESVRERARGVVDRLEASDVLRRDGGKWLVVLVAHGDVLQILQTAFAGVDPTQHRSLDHLQTATMRRLALPPDERVTLFAAGGGGASSGAASGWTRGDEAKIDPRWHEAARSWPPPLDDDEEEEANQ